jgi:hypothetical protein
LEPVAAHVMPPALGSSVAKAFLKSIGKEGFE